MVEPYLAALQQEIAYTAKLTEKAGLTVVSVYIGGGTPTALTAQQLQRLLAEIRNDFDLSKCEEFTVEAGRPDTIDRAKLDVMACNDVDRISINPQTLNDTVLETIGRRHTAMDFLRAWDISKEYSSF